MGKIGVGPFCIASIENNKQIIIQFGLGASIVVGDEVKFAKKALKFK